MVGRTKSRTPPPVRRSRPSDYLSALATRPLTTLSVHTECVWYLEALAADSDDLERLFVLAYVHCSGTIWGLVAGHVEGMGGTSTIVPMYVLREQRWTIIEDCRVNTLFNDFVQDYCAPLLLEWPNSRLWMEDKLPRIYKSNREVFDMFCDSVADASNKVQLLLPEQEGKLGNGRLAFSWRYDNVPPPMYL